MIKQFVGSLRRSLIRLVGASPKRLAGAGSEEETFAMRMACHALLTWAFLAFVSYVSLTVAFPASSGQLLSWGALLAAIFVSLLIFFVDLYIIHSSWYDHGRAELDAIRIDKRFSKSTILSPKLLFRVGLSFFLSFTLGLLLELRLFENEVSTVLNERYISENADLKNQIQSELLTTTVPNLDASIRAAQSRIRDLEVQRDRLEIGIEKYNAELQIKEIAGRIDQREQDLKRYRDERDAYRDEYNCEMSGRVCTNPITQYTTTGQPGCRSQCRTALTLATLAEGNVAVAEAEILELSRKRDALLSILSSPPAAANQADQSRIASLSEEIQSQSDRLSKLASEKNEIQGDFQKAVLSAMQQSSEYRPLNTGLLQKFDALKDFLFASPMAMFIFVLIFFLIIFLEMSAVLSKLFFSPKNLYSVETSRIYDEYRRKSLYQPDQGIEAELDWAKLKAETAKLRKDYDDLSR